MKPSSIQLAPRGVPPEVMTALLEDAVETIAKDLRLGPFVVGRCTAQCCFMVHDPHQVLPEEGPRVRDYLRTRALKEGRVDPTIGALVYKILWPEGV